MAKKPIHEEQAMNVLEGSETKFRDLVVSLNDWVWSIDLKGVHTFTNGAITALLGYKTEEVLNSSTFPLMHPDSKPRAEAVLRKSIAEKKGWRNLELKWLHKDGSSRYFESTAHADFDTHGKLKGKEIQYDVCHRELKIQYSEKSPSFRFRLHAFAPGVHVWRNK